ncbi:N-acetyltransferase family protein [Pseudomonas syringae]
MDEVISYREATVEDVAVICELGQLLNAIHHAERPDIYAAETLDYTRDAPHWMSFLNNPEQVIFLAFVGDRAAGFVSAGMFSAGGPLLQPMAFAHIGSVCVAQVYWGKGLGRGLIEHVQGWAQQRGAKDIRLSVWGFNTHARRLYEELGFETRAFEMGMRLT